jgi:hypothetical protein
MTMRRSDPQLRRRATAGLEAQVRSCANVVVGLFTFWYEMTSLSTSVVAGVLALSTIGLTIVGVRSSPLPVVSAFGNDTLSRRMRGAHG